MPKSKHRHSGFPALATILVASWAVAANQPLPKPFPPSPPIPTPIDSPYPGTLRLEVDATDLERGVFRVHETIPVANAGALTLLYPKWLPGDHAPSIPIEKLTGLVIRAAGQRLPWSRDPVDLWAFHIAVPPGVSELAVEFEFVAPIAARDWPKLMAPAMLDVWWPTVVLYPAGYFSRRISVAPTVRLPEGFEFATALETASTQGQLVHFAPTDLETLVDSPLVAGRYLRRFDLNPGEQPKVRLDLFADQAAELATMKPAQIAEYRAMVQQTQRLFGSHHYDHYDFLFWLSDSLSFVGLEHQQSSEDGASATFFSDWKNSINRHDTAPHEYVHSWNGKFRRPADLWTPDFDTPMRDDLLWVYEGLTQYLGYVLMARSDLLSKQDTLDAFATFAAICDNQPGGAWRPLQDTAFAPILDVNRRPDPWPSWQRGREYYLEGLLVWLDTDTLIRQLSHGKRSLDDFVRSFYGVYDGSRVTSTYTFDDVVRALNAVQPYDWARFFRARLDAVGTGAPLDGLTRGGYRLVYDNTQSAFSAAWEGSSDLSRSLGLTASADGQITDIVWEGPAFKGGLMPGMKILAVNGEAFDPKALDSAVIAAAGSGPSVQLLIERGDHYSTVTIDYHGGMRYPHLTRIPATPARLDDILQARS